MAPSRSPVVKTSLYQSLQAVGPCQTCGAIPSSIDAGTAHVAAIPSMSPLLKASMYWPMAPIGSVVSARDVDAVAQIAAMIKSAWRAVGIPIKIAPPQR